MKAKRSGTHALHSLRTQLVGGAVLLLGLTAGAISYALLQHEKFILMEEMEKTIVLQGRNVALSSERALLRPDPEFELFPLVKRILSESSNITSVVITDAEGTIQGDEKLQNLGGAYDWYVPGYTLLEPDGLLPNEALYQSRDTYRFRTPVKNRENIIGFVHIDYSRADFHESFARALRLTYTIGGIAFIFSILLSLFLFRRISKPMDVLVRGVKRLGEGHLDTTIEVRVRNEFSVLADSFNDMAGKIARAQEDLVQKERMDRELEIARDIQTTLIPTETFVAEGMEIGTYYDAAAQVGGDYLDIIPIDSRNIAFVMADVSGKGVPGLVVMAMLKIMVRSMVTKGISPCEVIRRLNTTVADHVREKMFVTLFLAYIQTDSGDVVYSNAGHNPLGIYRSDTGQCELQRLKGPPLGIFKDKDYAKSLEEYTTRLKSGDIMLQYTDGLSESTNNTGEFFSFERIINIGNAHGGQGAKALVRALRRAEREFRGTEQQADDITLLAVSMKLGTREKTRSET
jgi:serine phosphatase RsbU (regulator of sigma subunit)